LNNKYCYRAITREIGKNRKPNRLPGGTMGSSRLKTEQLKQADDQSIFSGEEILSFPLHKDFLPDLQKNNLGGLRVSAHSLPRSSSPIMICLLGDFRILKEEKPIDLPGAKAESFLCGLALQHNFRIPRDIILESLWPEHPPALAGQSLNSLVYNLHKTFGDVLQGNSLVCYQDGYYFINKAAGVGIDIDLFDGMVHMGNQQLSNNNRRDAVDYYLQAIQLYRGDLCTDKELNAKVERERLRAHFLTTLSQIADYYFFLKDYGFCLQHIERLLQVDPCREDAHRLAMCCYVRMGERAQALRQFRLCEFVLRAEFDAAPEPRTMQLFDQIRLAPETV
jgi:DNA-binding SARP family transcriptional activator